MLLDHRQPSARQTRSTVMFIYLYIYIYTHAKSCPKVWRQTFTLNVMRRASNPHTQPYVNVRRQRHAAGSHGRLYTAGAMRHEAESRSPPRSKSSLCVTVIRQAQRQRHASGVRRHAPCASLERHSQSSKSGVKIMRQRHASES